ncbi:predicted protein [Histoplasma capsulatum G186AR]|uniref:Uncharacterized protein n=1 Tax=Ajellomyces capsulatus (strain G186AR / H82 / ATCC MYA-2454 / RMSCC 2432) TaxID=447093 RepID=C0NDX3_AJECG|nr:uncharacterized protein HCBG_02066 [Histoplasma capsulatum G186AR]EEH10421.1 predicted protein [Histoplasma capsulatum G186AR]
MANSTCTSLRPIMTVYPCGMKEAASGFSYQPTDETCVNPIKVFPVKAPYEERLKLVPSPGLCSRRKFNIQISSSGSSMAFEGKMVVISTSGEARVTVPVAWAQ